MANYPSYYPNNQMGMYQSPVYNPQYQNYQSYQPQYQQNMLPTQMSGTPQQQVQQMPVGLNGRFVDDFSTLNANDVPMDGNGAVFIKRDASEIQWRNWAANGTIVTTSYKPILEQNNQEGTNIPQMDLNTLYEDVKALRGEITERFDRLEKSMANSNTKAGNPRSKKEADSE